MTFKTTVCALILHTPAEVNGYRAWLLVTLHDYIKRQQGLTHGRMIFHLLTNPTHPWHGTCFVHPGGNWPKKCGTLLRTNAVHTCFMAASAPWRALPSGDRADTVCMCECVCVVSGFYNATILFSRCFQPKWCTTQVGIKTGKKNLSKCDEDKRNPPCTHT